MQGGEPLHGEAFFWEALDIKRIGGDFDGDDLIGPGMVMEVLGTSPNAPEPSGPWRMYSPRRC